MPTVIAIEAKPLGIGNINSEFHHLYLVKTVTDSQGHILSEKVIRGNLEADGSLGTLANADLATSPDRRSVSMYEARHRTVLDLDGRSAEDVWKVMVKHAVNIDRAHLSYSIDIYGNLSGSDRNSNSVVASVLHSVGIDWAQNFPIGISPGEAPLYGQLGAMKVNDSLSGTERKDKIYGGVGSDSLYGLGQNDYLSGESGNDRLWGGSGNDQLVGGSGDDRLYGGYGQDILRGDAGKDAFVFTTAVRNTTSFDTIRYYSVADDTIWLDNAVFTALGRAGHLSVSAFWTGTMAHDVTDRIIYNSGNGSLYYDPDGTGAANQVTIAKMTAGLKMSYAEFLVI
jgi:Ca2+-binding RTX toxin-like protein